MKRNAFAFGALALSAVLLSAPTWAQAPDNAPPPPMQGGGPGGFGGGPGGFQGGRGGRAGFAGRFAMGTVSAVNASASTITVTPRGGGPAQTIQVPPSASVITQTPTTVSSLRVGEQVRVSGVPTTFTASQITVGTLPAGLPGQGGPGGGFGGRRGGGPGGPPNGGFGGGGRGGGPGQGGTMTLTASVLSVNPLTLMLPDNTSVTLKMASDAKINRMSTTTVGSVKVGDQIFATGQTGDDGTFTATTVADNLDMGIGGPGGFGGGRGGFGGGQGGRMRRGGRGGGGGDNGNAMPPPPDGAGPPPPNDGF